MQMMMIFKVLNRVSVSHQCLKIVIILGLSELKILPGEGMEFYSFGEATFDVESFTPFYLKLNELDLGRNQQEIKKRKELYLKLGLKQNLKVKDIIGVLHSFQQKFDPNVLTEEWLQRISSILSCLKKRAEKSKVDLKDFDVYAPNEEGILKLSKELYYNDAKGIGTSGKHKGFYIHEKIPKSVVEKIGVKMIKAESLQSMKSKFPFGNAFGQKEELVTRIKNILNEYDGEIDIFKELIQNADDSGASEFNLVFDKRRHRDTGKGFNSMSKHLLGPALIASNNKPFAEKDYEGLKQLGTGSKRSDEDSIGKFGIGFNTVYSVTDTPMFISNNKFVILDPHLEFSALGEISEPGAMFDICPEFELLCKDVLGTFSLPQGLTDFKETGTMFRLPLREDFSSRISEEVSLTENIQEVETQLKQFKDIAGDCLVFLNNIRKINVTTIDENGQMKTEIEVSSKINNNPKLTKKEVMRALKQKDASVAQTVAYDLTISEKGDVERNSNYKVAWALKETPNERSKSSGVALNMELIRDGVKESGRLFVGLPIKASIDLPALVCGNFELDPGRNSLKPESSWNTELLSGVCVEAYVAMMEAVRNDIIEVQKHQNSHTVNMDHCNLYGEEYHHLFPRPATQSNTLFPFMKSFYHSIQEKELVPCIFVDVDQKGNERSYFKFEPLKSSLIIDEKKLGQEMNLLMKLRCPVVFFRYKCKSYTIAP